MKVENTEQAVRHLVGKKSLTKVYEQTGVSLSTLCRWRSGDDAMLSKIINLADGLGYELQLVKKNSYWDKL